MYVCVYMHNLRDGVGVTWNQCERRLGVLAGAGQDDGGAGIPVGDQCLCRAPWVPYPFPIAFLDTSALNLPFCKMGSSEYSLSTVLSLLVEM